MNKTMQMNKEPELIVGLLEDRQEIISNRYQLLIYNMFLS